MLKFAEGQQVNNMSMHSYIICPVAISDSAVHCIWHSANFPQTSEDSPLDACRSGKDYAAVLAANVVGKQMSCRKRVTCKHLPHLALFPVVYLQFLVLECQPWYIGITVSLCRAVFGDQTLPAPFHEEEDKGDCQLIIHLWVHQCNSQRGHWGREPPSQRAVALQH